MQTSGMNRVRTEHPAKYSRIDRVLMILLGVVLFVLIFGAAVYVPSMRDASDADGGVVVHDVSVKTSWKIVDKILDDAEQAESMSSSRSTDSDVATDASNLELDVTTPSTTTDSSGAADSTNPADTAAATDSDYTRQQPIANASTLDYRRLNETAAGANGTNATDGADDSDGGDDMTLETLATLFGMVGQDVLYVSIALVLCVGCAAALCGPRIVRRLRATRRAARIRAAANDFAETGGDGSADNLDGVLTDPAMEAQVPLMMHPKAAPILLP